MKTAQEVFNQSVQGLRKQNKKALDANGYCRYRTEDGLKCAAGQLIPSNLYNPKFEGKTVRVLPLEVVEGSWGQENSLLVGKLQEVHDCRVMETWELEWSEIARQFGLTMPKKEDE